MDKYRARGSELPWQQEQDHTYYRPASQSLAQLAHAGPLRCTRIRLEPHSAGWPVHFHSQDEEAIYVLRGSGTLRKGPHTFTVSAGTWVTHLPGLFNAAHQLSAGDQPVEYLCFSIQSKAELLGFPDSGKLTFFTEAPKGWVELILPGSTQTVGYYTGEKGELLNPAKSQTTSMLAAVAQQDPAWTAEQAAAFIVREQDVPLQDWGPPTERHEHYNARYKALARKAGAKQLGCRLIEVASGKGSRPHHFHCNVDEAIYILSGSGTMRVGSETLDAQPDDFFIFRPGPAFAHSIRNTGGETLRYLSLSNKADVDLVGYPDSRKVMYLATLPCGQAPVCKMISEDVEGLGYFHGE